MISDPELPGHLLLEQYQAQLVSAVRTALDSSSGPILLEAGLQLATKILTSGIISGDQVAVKRIFSLISRPLNEFEDLYYPSFAEWVSCKIKIRLLAAHASLKCYTYAFLRRHQSGVPNEYLALLPLFSKSSTTLGKYWIWILKDYSYICFHMYLNRNWKPFLDGIQSPLVSSKLRPCLEEAWPVILQALSLDAIPVNCDMNGSSESTSESISNNTLISGYSMVELELEEFRFLWGFSLLVLFQRQHPALGVHIIPLSSAKAKFGGDSPVETNSPSLKLHEIVLPVFQFLSTELFFSMGFLTIDLCQELLQVFSYSVYMEDSWDSLAISVLSQVVRNCPGDFVGEESFVCPAMELCLAYIFKVYHIAAAVTPEHPNWENAISPLFTTAKTLLSRFEPEKQIKSLLAFLLIGYKCIRGASTELSFSKVNDFAQYTSSLLKKHVEDKSKLDDDAILNLRTILSACLNAIVSLTNDCIDGIRLLENKRTDLRKLLQLKLAFSLEQAILFATLFHEIECHGERKESNPDLFTMFNHSTLCIQAVLINSDIQVQAIGLQMLKSIVQKSTNVENNSFLVFFIGEFFRDIFAIIVTRLKKPITRESVAVVGECLRILVLVQTLAKASECQRGLMSLLLDAIVMVFSATEDDGSQEVYDIRSTAARLVSHLAQIPSSAVHFKDVLVAMPVAHRQQIQGIIRASVAQDQSPAQTTTSAPSPALVIKLPSQTEQKNSPSALSNVNFTKEEDEDEKEEEEEDDWDAFQSFPASTDPTFTNSKLESASNAEEPTLSENPSISDSIQVKDIDITNEDHQKAVEENVVSESVNNPESENNLNEIKQQDDSHSNREKEDAAVASQETNQVSSDLQPVENAEGSIKVELVEGEIKEVLSDKSGSQVSSDPSSFRQASDNETD